MQKRKILAIYRLPLFSNNAIEADRLILEQSVEVLRSRCLVPLDIDFCEEPEVGQIQKSYDLALTMTQSAEALNILDQKSALVPVLWNSTHAIRNCYRKRMSELLQNTEAKYAPYALVNTEDSIEKHMVGGIPYWLKRGDFHAISDDDVTLAETPTEAKIKLENFRQKGVKEIILQKHIVGDIYKFYGVEGGFFRAIRVRKFLDQDLALPEQELKVAVDFAAKRLGLMVYGGDCILSADGSFHLIDLNDWPSFRICREDASNAIGSLAAKYLNQLVSREGISSRA